MKKIFFILSLLFVWSPVFCEVFVTPYGAAEIVSGSCFLVESEGTSALVDCGQFMKNDLPNDDLNAKNAFMPEELTSAEVLILTHAHTDHCGRIPLLINKGFKGKIYSTRATKELALALFRNRTGFELIERKWFWSQSQKIKALNSKSPVVAHWTQSCRSNIKKIEESSKEMSFDQARKEAGVDFRICRNCSENETDSLIASYFVDIAYDQETVVSDDLKFKLINAGHIPGSASVIFEAGGKKIVFSGDLGSGYSRLTGLPDIPQKADALFIEATYADDRHSLNFKDYEVFRKDLIKSVSKGKTVWIPALAFNRTQKVLYEINLMQKEGLLSKDIPVYSVSPSANVMNALYQKEALEKSGGWFLPEVYNGGSVLPKGLRQQMVRGYDAQMILLSASGDMDYGMSEKLAPVMLAKKDVSVMIVNYVSPQSAAARLLSGEYKSKIKSKALVKKYDIFSDHPDFSGISRWLENQDKDAFIYIIHSSRQNSLNMKKLLEDAGRSNASVALERRKITI